MKKNNKQSVKIKARMLTKIQPFLESCGIEKESIDNAIEKALMEIRKDENSAQSWLLSLVFCKIFGDNGFFLTDNQTPAGNDIPFDILIAAYKMWQDAKRTAAMSGLDDLDAVEALVSVVNIVTDRLARGNGATILNINKYMQTVYINELKRLAEKIGIIRFDDLKPNERVSDDGAFFDALENGMTRDKLLRGLSAKEKDAVGFYYAMGHSCKETAALMGLSNSAVRQILSRAVQKCSESLCGKSRRRGKLPKRRKNSL